VVTPRTSIGGARSLRGGIDQLRPDQIAQLSRVDGTEALARALALLERARPKWHRDALCREYPTLNFTSPRSASAIAACLQVCGRCSVLDSCRSWAMEIDATDGGVYGGMDPAARRLARKQRTKS
jgi:hypothetical protein